MAKLLTVKAIEHAAPDSTKRREIADGGVTGLYLVVQPSGAKSWAVRYRFEGKSRKHTIGPFPRIDLAAARETARGVLATASEGRDPEPERASVRRATASVTETKTRVAVGTPPDEFERYAGTFIDRYAKAKNKSWQQSEGMLKRYAIPAWHGRRIGDITKRDVIALLDSIVDRGSPIAANRTLATIRKLFAWAASRDDIAASPCTGVQPPSAETARERVLTDGELGEVWAASATLGYPYRDAIRMMVLTAARRDEVLGMLWDEVDVSAATWTLPAARTKNKRTHALPLCKSALAILASVNVVGDCPYVFSTTGRTPSSGSSKAKVLLDKRIHSMREAAAIEAGADVKKVRPMEHWTLHDLRRTAATRMADLGVEPHVIEALLNHVSGAKAGVAGVYNRSRYSEQMRATFDLWNDHITSLSQKR